LYSSRAVTATVSYDPATNSAFLDPNVRPGTICAAVVL
jgi:hypothetical protein